MRNYLTTAVALLLASCTASRGEVPGLSKLDADDDGKISRQEAAQSRELMNVFDRADTNDDGFLDSADLQRARDLIREQDRGQNGGHQRPPH